MTTQAGPGRRYPFAAVEARHNPLHLTEDELMNGYGRGREPARSSAEDDLLSAIGYALSLTGWTWQHVRRSDLALVQGSPGFPDLIAIRDGTMLVIECKSERGQPTLEQVGWLRAWRAIAALAPHRMFVMVVRPSDLDTLLNGITGADPEAFAALTAATWPARDPEQDAVNGE